MDNPDSITQLTAWWRDFSESIDSKEVISRFMKRINRLKKNVPPIVEGSAKVSIDAASFSENTIGKIPFMFVFFPADS